MSRSPKPENTRLFKLQRTLLYLRSYPIPTCDVFPQKNFWGGRVRPRQTGKRESGAESCGSCCCFAPPSSPMPQDDTVLSGNTTLLDGDSLDASCNMRTVTTEPPHSLTRIGQNSRALKLSCPCGKLLDFSVKHAGRAYHSWSQVPLPISRHPQRHAGECWIFPLCLLESIFVGHLVEECVASHDDDCLEIVSLTVFRTGGEIWR